MEHPTDPLRQVCYADTFENVCRVEGRRVHWVGEWDTDDGNRKGDEHKHEQVQRGAPMKAEPEAEADRFSLIYYQTKGEYQPLNRQESVLSLDEMRRVV